MIAYEVSDGVCVLRLNAPPVNALTLALLAELQTAIGTADIELNLFMTGEGMQIEFVDTSTGQRTRQTMTWGEVYAG